MERLVIRHGVPRKTPTSVRSDIDLFNGPRLTARGFLEAQSLGDRLPMPESRLIASSEAASAIDTGHAIAGTSADVVAYELLNEVKLDMPEAELTAMLALGLVPDEALNAADRILRNPPEESIWISHGLLIAGLTAVLNEHRAIDLKKRSLFPDYLEVRSFRI